MPKVRPHCPPISQPSLDSCSRASRRLCYSHWVGTLRQRCWLRAGRPGRCLPSVGVGLLSASFGWHMVLGSAQRSTAQHHGQCRVCPARVDTLPSCPGIEPTPPHPPTHHPPPPPRPRPPRRLGRRHDPGVARLPAHLAGGRPGALLPACLPANGAQRRAGASRPSSAHHSRPAPCSDTPPHPAGLPSSSPSPRVSYTFTLPPPPHPPCPAGGQRDLGGGQGHRQQVARRHRVVQEPPAVRGALSSTPHHTHIHTQITHPTPPALPTCVWLCAPAHKSPLG